jgi:hypothetical protein
VAVWGGEVVCFAEANDVPETVFDPYSLTPIFSYLVISPMADSFAKWRNGLLEKRFSKMKVGSVIILLALFGLGWGGSRQYKVTRCEVYRDAAALYFDAAPWDPQRKVGFNDRGKWMEVALGFGMRKSVDWTNVRSIRIQLHDKSKEEIVFAIDFDQKVASRQNPYEFGLIDKNCLDRIRAKYDRVIKFVS